MCGIAGMVMRARPVAAEQLQAAAGRLRHRGPDDHGVYAVGNVGLAHTRLSIIDLAGGHQPLADAAGQLALIANGEVYNFVELRAEIEAGGRRFATRSDSESILHVYALDPEGFARRLHGMFAFALHDRGRRRVVLGRDRLGIKPLFYAVLPDRVVFASELKAILPLLPGAPSVNPWALVQVLESRFSTGAETILREVRRVEPAETVTIDVDTLHVQRRPYWSALDVRPRRLTQEQAEEEFTPLVAQVMKEHVRSDVPYGLFLSGGNDSAILLALLNAHQPGTVRTFSVGYADVQIKDDELADAERMARAFGTAHVSLALRTDAVFRRLPYAVWAADDLMVDWANLPTSLLAEEAARTLKVVFTGEGGDEVFAGYGRYRRSPWQRFLTNLRAPGSGGFRTRGAWSRRWSRRLFGPELAAAGDAFRAPYVAAWRRTPRSWTHIQRAQYTDIATALADGLLVKVDRMLMGFGLEGRVPYLDHRIVEFGLSLPDDLKVRGRTPKRFLRRWAERHIPRDHLYKRKRGFNVPVSEFLTGKLLDRLQETLRHSPAIEQWFRTAELPALFAAHRAGDNVKREIWSLACLAIWHRLFVERPGARPGGDEDPLDWMR
jgi:asparagine synthase (glutamine-hydrolysing)